MESELFLKQCSESGDAAYSALKSLLEKLENPSTRAEARVFCSNIQKRFQEDSLECFKTYHFRIHDILLSDYHVAGFESRRKKLTMMEIPSIFIPEDWSFTFYEGLNRQSSDSIFKDRTVAELGCGNGWISIALAEKWSPSKASIYLLLLLHPIFHPNHHLIITHNQRRFTDLISIPELSKSHGSISTLTLSTRPLDCPFMTLITKPCSTGSNFMNLISSPTVGIIKCNSNALLDAFLRSSNNLIITLISFPFQLLITVSYCQILNPNPEAMSKMITENASEEFLFSLSNYCALQGFVEDQFGLGLIARAVEEGISVIKPMGIMIFNIGGRPGQGVCKRLFERRGFHVTKLWQTKVMQAADTDISALVEIEKNSRHRFEFFMGLVGDQPICARSAWAYGKAGGRISHALSVKIIFDFLKNGFQDISSSLDLSFDDDSVADEKIPFLSYLASVLKENPFFPYEPPSGSTEFRDLIAGFMKVYHHVPLKTDNVVIFPSRAAAIENALRLFSPRLAIVDEHLTRNLPKGWLTSLAIEGATDGQPSEDVVTVIEAPRQSDLMIELIKKLKPQVVVTGMAHYEAVTSSSFGHLVDTTRDVGSRLFLDISDQLELSSLPGSNGVLKYLAGNTLPPHTAILCGLVRNQVYSDLEVAFVISEEESVFKALSKTVELLEGNTALFSQYYYGCLFHELLAFQLADRHPLAQRECPKVVSAEMIGFSKAAISVLNDAELSLTSAKSASLVHMDVDQSFLPVPAPVKAAIFESFARQNMLEAETDVKTCIRQFIKSSYGFPSDSCAELIYADSALSLFNKLILCCIQEGGTLCVAAGSNGTYVSAANFLKANVVSLLTSAESGFKLTGNALTDLLAGVDRPWVYLSGPTINPTGLLYSNQEIQEILSVCAKFGARVVIDTSFSGLEFNTEGWGGWNLENSLSELTCSGNSSFCVSLLGGLSFELLTGGLTFGFLVLNQPLLIDAFYSSPNLSKPHCTVKYAIKKLLTLKEKKEGNLLEAVSEQKGILRARSKRLMETLQRHGWDAVECYGGVSMVAKPSAYHGRTLKLNLPSKVGDTTTNAEAFEAKLDDSNIREALRKATGLCINSGLWTGIPGYCRFTIALEDKEFERALDCIIRFHKVVCGN
ncbi:hypothetical protein IFM89_039612 [Coptis chinensis]|uniref:methionine S-methyltransferase n=1 Tax=Coptis chinensis TaxID=261450 RepID=A0A835GWI9_9MAGN|nr:hypothetical protein IFM89_039612 [Coptis chinensis]